MTMTKWNEKVEVAVKKKYSVIWARVSGKNQTDISPISQVAQCKDKLGVCLSNSLKQA